MVAGLLDGLTAHQRYKRGIGQQADQFDKDIPSSLDLSRYDGEVVNRGELFPIGEYRQPDGSNKFGLAWPGILSGDLPQMGDRSPEAAQAYGRAAVSGAMFPGAGRAAAGVPSNALGMFGGRLAKTADQAALAKAEELAAKGAPREQIWTETGWFQGPDKKWRFEIDDSGMGPRNATDWTPKGKQWDAYEQSWVSPTESFEWQRNSGKSNSLAGVHGAFTHDELIKAYPDVANARLGMKSGSDGLYEPPFKNSPERITLGGDLDISDATSLAAHEIQHAIQNREGFAHGAALRGWGDDAERSYRNTSGEVEARAVQTRLKLTPEQRRARFPWLDYDVPESQQIIRGILP